MFAIFPSINCHFGDDDCVRSKVSIAASFARRVHVDVADGIFTFNKSWNDPVRWKSLAGSIEFEVHLMTEDPRAHANLWLSAGASRLIVHAETIPPEEFAEFAGVCHHSGVELMLSSNPEYKAEKLAPYFGMTHAFQVLAVHPGPDGQKFLPRVLEKIAYLRAHVQGAVIEVDGGITPDTLRACLGAGANEFVSGEYLFGNDDPARAYAALLGT